MKLEERLNEQLIDAENKIYKLERKLEDSAHTDQWHWRHIFQISEEDNLGLPLPRMEIRYRLDDHNAYADYGLVLRHFTNHIDFIPLSSTRVSKDYAKKLELPYRDGAHIIFDKENLKLPAYIVYGKQAREITFKIPQERTNY